MKATLLAVFLALHCLAASTPLEKPTATNSSQAAPTGDKAVSAIEKDDKRIAPAAAKQVSPIAATPAQEALSPAKKDETRGEAELKSFHATHASAWIALVMAMIALLQAYMFFVQLKHMQQSNEVATNIARVALSQSNRQMSADRAVLRVDIKGGLTSWVEDGHGIKVFFGTRNIGNTPATVTLETFGQALLKPGERLPGYAKLHPSTTERLQVKDEAIYASMAFKHTQIENQAVRRGELRVVLFGYVDYIDIFGRRHRGGFAKELLVNPDGPNEDGTDFLAFHILDDRNFNFDRERTVGDGIDWTPEAIAEYQMRKSAER